TIPATGPPKGGSSRTVPMPGGPTIVSGSAAASCSASTARWSRVRPPVSNSGFAAPSTRDARPPARTIAPTVMRSLAGPGPGPWPGAPPGAHPAGPRRGRPGRALPHVDHGERRDRDRRERLHLTPGAVRGAHRRGDLDALVLHVEVDGAAVHADDVREG